VPASPEVYLHRIGRTGRAGRGGTAITLAEPREQRHLRSIEGFTKSRLDIGKIPTVADLRARRLELTRASLRERLVAADFDDVRVVVESLSDEFDPIDIAAAAVKMAHDALGGNEDREIPASAPIGASAFAGTATADKTAGRPAQAFERPQRSDRDGRPAGRLVKRDRSFDKRDLNGNGVRLFIGAGRAAGIRPGDLVGAITGEADVPSRSLGAIEIADKFSLVEVPEALADRIIAALKATKIRGQKVNVRREKTI
jgi:ATP-dependent RNA helicase DeaD